MSDSDQNERDRLPWWLKPLAGGRDAKKAKEAETPSDSGADEEETAAVEVDAADLSAAETPEPETMVSAPSIEDAAEPQEAAASDDSDAGDAQEGSSRRGSGRGRSRGSRRGRSRRSLWTGDEGESDSAGEAEPGSGTEAEASDSESPAETEEWAAADSRQPSSDPSDGEETDADAMHASDEASSDEPASDEDASASSSSRSRSRRRGKRGGKKKHENSGRTTVESTSHELSFAAMEPVIEMLPAPERTLSVNDERKLGIFCDFENIALGVRDSEIKRFDITIVLERLLEKGKIIVKKAYADWERYSDYKRKFHESAIELIDIPQKYYSGKNSADIKMVVDAMEVSYTKDHLDTIVLMSGDSDFSPLVSKLKENNKTVIGVGVKNSSSNLLVDNCDEFIYYEDIWRDLKKDQKRGGSAAAKGGSKNVKSTEAFNLLVTSMKALMRDNKDVLWGSMIKQTMQRKKPSFNEGYYGYSTFSELLEDAERQNLVKLKKDQRSGTYIVTGFAGER